MRSTAAPLQMARRDVFANQSSFNNINEMQSADDFSRGHQAPTKKVFHCVVDEITLLDNVSTIKKMAVTGAVRLILPLACLEAVERLKRGSTKRNANAREVIRFLEGSQQKSPAPDASEHRPVKIQGPNEQYMDWEEVEQTYHGNSSPVPENHVSIGEKPVEEFDEADDAADMAGLLPGWLEQQLGFTEMRKSHSRNVSGASDQGAYGVAGPGEPHQLGMNGFGQATDGLAKRCPEYLRGSLNCALWYAHKNPENLPDTNPVIFLTNDPDRFFWGQQFGLHVNRVAQLENSIKLEERDSKNRMKLVEKTKKQEMANHAAGAARKQRGFTETDRKRWKNIVPQNLEQKQQQQQQQQQEEPCDVPKPAEGQENGEDEEEEEEEIVFKPRGSKSPPKPISAPLTPAPGIEQTMPLTKPNTPPDSSERGRHQRTTNGPMPGRGSPRGSPRGPRAGFRGGASRGGGGSAGSGRGGNASFVPREATTGRRGGPNEEADVEYHLVSGAPRSAARGRGKLWIP